MSALISFRFAISRCRFSTFPENFYKVLVSAKLTIYGEIAIIVLICILAVFSTGDLVQWVPIA